MTQSRSDAEVGLHLTKFIFSGLHDSFQARIKRRLSIVEYFLNHVSCLESKESPELKKCKSINQFSVISVFKTASLGSNLPVGVSAP